MNEQQHIPANRVTNPFGSTEIVNRETEALVEVESQRAMAEVQASMMMAQRFKRKPAEAMDRIINACTRLGLAEKATYTYARGGTDISGPSIRLAEAIAQGWGNIKCSTREIEQRRSADKKKPGNSTMMTIAWDLETGYSEERIFQIPHWRDTQGGGYAITDARDIYELTANAASRRRRACILAVIPGDVIEAAVNQCDVTLKTRLEVTPERIIKVLESFDERGVSKEQLEAFLQRRMEAMLPAQLYRLGKILNSINDGMSLPGDWFKPTGEIDPETGEIKSTTAATAATATGASALKAKMATATSKPADAGAAGATSQQQPAGETGAQGGSAGAQPAQTGKVAGKSPTKDNGAPPLPTPEQFQDRVMKAQTVDDVQMLQSRLGEYPVDVQAKLREFAAARFTEIQDKLL